MYPSSTAYKETVVNAERSWGANLRISLDSGDVLDITETDLSINTLRFTEGATCSDAIQTGATFANTLSFTLINDEKQFSQYSFENARVTGTVSLFIGDTPEAIPLGVFTITSAGKKLTTIPIECTDDMYLLNVPLASLNLVFPMTPADLLDTIATATHIPVATAFRNELANLNFSIEAFNQDDYTCRDIIGFLATLIAKNARFNRSGLLEAYWYTNSGQETTADTRVGNASYEDLVMQYNGVRMSASVNGAEVTYLSGLDDQLAEYILNPLIPSEAVLESVADITLVALNELPYHPCTVSFIGDPTWQAGDIITHVRESEDDPNIVAPLTQITFVFRGTSSLESAGQPAKKNRQLTAAAKALLQQKTQAAQDLNKGLLEMQQVILAQTDLITNALGFYPYVEYNADGSIRGYYLMSTPEDTPTTTVWAFTSGGIGLSHTGLAGPYTSSWTANDSIVAHVITADMIKTGILAAIDNLLTINLANGKFEAKTQNGTTTIEGNVLTLQHRSSQDIPLAYMRLEASDASAGAITAVSFASKDGGDTAIIKRDITYNGSDTDVTSAGPLTLQSTLPIKVLTQMEIADALMYKKLCIKRNDTETGNTGVDFVLLD